MGHTFTNHLYHIVFSTKGRKPVITPRIEEDLHKYICGIARNCGGRVLKINGVVDHVHILAQVKPSISISEFLQLVKTNSSKWVSESFADVSWFEWQAGYSSFTVSESQSKKVGTYIERQKERHQSETFAEELARIFKKHRIEFDPRHYLD